MEQVSALENPPLAEPHAPRLHAAVGAIVVYFLIQLAVGAVLGLALGIVYMLTTGATDPKHMMTATSFMPMLVLVLLPISCGISFAVFKKWFRATWKLSDSIGVGITVPLPLPRMAMYLALGLLASIIGTVLTRLLTQGHPVTQDISQIMQHTTLALQLGIALVTVTIVPLVEEVLFRGILLPALMRHTTVAWAVLIDAALFALIHLPDLSWKPQGLLALALVGAVCCWARLKTGSLRASIAVHAGNNLLAMVALVAMGLGTH